MKVLHISPHYGGGVGTVVMGWVGGDKGNTHTVLSLDTLNEKVGSFLVKNKIGLGWEMIRSLDTVDQLIEGSDVVVIHLWDHPMLQAFLKRPLPASRLALWAHKNFPLGSEPSYADRFVVTSPVVGGGKYQMIWSTGGVDRFLKIVNKPHEGINVGYVGTVDWKKLHGEFVSMVHEIASAVPDIHFTVVGENNIANQPDSFFNGSITFTGKVDDVAPYLEGMDIFGYPLRHDHYGTCEQVLGEAMAAGIPPVVMDNLPERYIVSDGWDGFIARNEKEYVHRVQYLAAHKEVRLKMGARARERAAKLYSLDYMIQAWSTTFEEMMDSPKKERDAI